MPAKNPRVNVVLERPLYDALGRVARVDGSSLSTKARDLLRDALERREDAGLLQVAEDRARSFDARSALTHEQVFARSRRGRRR
jgi:hypothetical protein